MWEARKNQNDVKNANTHMLIDLIKSQRPISRAQLAKKSGMSPTSISRIVGFLENIGVVYETDSYSCGVGRRAVLLDLAPDSLYSVGVHIDREYLKLCIVDFGQNIVCSEQMTFSAFSYQPQEIAALAWRLFERCVTRQSIDRKRILGLGVGVVGTVDNESGIVLLAPQLDWHQQDLRTAMQEAFSMPTVIENDVKASLWGERVYSNIPPEQDITLLLLGSGVGSAATTGGQIMRGSQNAAGEIGHVITDQHGVMCECGRRGCLQTHMAEGFLLRRAREHDKAIDSMTALRSAYDRQEPWALDIMADYSQHLFLALDILLSLYNSSVVIVSGTLLQYFEDLVAPVAERLMRSIYQPLFNKGRILCSTAAGNGCQLGAAILAMDLFIVDQFDRQLDPTPPHRQSAFRYF